MKKKLIVLAICTLSTAVVGCFASEKDLSQKEYRSSEDETVQVTEENNMDMETEDLNIPKHNELGDISQETELMPITFSDSSYADIKESLNSNPVHFIGAEYFGLDQALKLYNNTILDEKTNFDLLNDNEKLDSDKLYDQVIKNNREAVVDEKNTLNIMYKDLSDSDIRTFCDIITKTINENDNKVPMKDIANTLSELTMFERTGTVSNAYISDELTLVYSHNASNLYDSLKNEDNDVSTMEEVITHETMHLIQYGTNDLNNDNGIEAGFNRMYNKNDTKIPVDSLWYRWILEGSAELGMSEYLNTEPGTYKNNIAYIHSYDLSRFNKMESQDHSLKNIVFLKDIDEVFQILNLTTDEEKSDFFKLMYSIEITQYDKEDFWEYYTDQTNETLTDEEQTEMRKEIRTAAVRYLTSSFFSNLTDALHEGKIKDLNTAFYLLRLWEMDTYSHINTEFNEINNADKEELQGFVSWYVNMQNQLLASIAQDNNLDLDTIKSMYDNYTVLVRTEDRTIKENCDLSNFSSYMQDYLKNIKNDYTYANFQRISDVFQVMKTTN